MSFLVTVPGGIVIDTNSVDAFLSVKKLLIMLDPTSSVSIRLVLPWVKQCVFVS